ncbi:MAG TPA: argininosuccinate lyase [Clostridiales bacterium]|nr:argininosuccinate lyase [Clostridiales bacterium]
MKLWGGVFTRKTEKLADEFNSSLCFDCRLYKHDILGSIAHCKMLGSQKIISEKESKLIIDGLEQILKDIENSKLKIEGAEDIHSFVEQELIKRIGETGKKLHTARSRNDQVATDIRMYLKDSIDNTVTKLKNLCAVMLEHAQNHADTIMAGYTHMQKAQPITLGHYFNAYVCMFLRDIERLKDCKKRIDGLPLGSGALAGTTYPIDRELTAKLLGFAEISPNSLDAVSDRDFLVEYISACALIGLHMSKIAEEWIYWACDEFSYITLDEGYSTGSSIMPQKKNPDMLELIRGKSAKIIGNLTSAAALLKAQPLSYNKDLQEDKPIIFDTEDNINICIDVLCGVIKTVKFNTDKMYSSALGGYSSATDIADYLAKKGVPFRDAHNLTGRIVLYCIKNNLKLEDLKLNDFKKFNPIFEQDVLDAVKLENVVNNRKSFGGTAPDQVRKTIEILEKKLKEL